jgi:hypothetical protein
VEHQCRYLSTSAGSRTPEARSALKHLLDDAVIFYRGDLYPIRRARHVPNPPHPLIRIDILAV